MPKTTPGLPLFPLHTVLYPGGILPLRIFETRYLDMVKRCTSNNTGFGVCMLLDNPNEKGADDEYQSARMAAIGTEAEIIDFDTGADGILTLIVRGRERFQVTGTHIQHDGLIISDIDWLPGNPGHMVLPQHSLLVEMLQHLHSQVEQQLSKQGDESGRNYHPALNCDYDDAENIGYRLAEILPLDLHEQQVLLEITESHARLDRLLDNLSDKDNQSAYSKKKTFD